MKVTLPSLFIALSLVAAAKADPATTEQQQKPLRELIQKKDCLERAAHAACWQPGSARNIVRVNGRLETTAPDVWALGECAGSPQFTHISEDDFRIVRDNLAGGNRSTRDRLVPYCMFTDPPLARDQEIDRRDDLCREDHLDKFIPTRAQADISGPQGKSEDQPLAKQRDNQLGTYVLPPMVGSP
jgi:hypothetical protein